MGRKEFFREIDVETRLRVLVVTERGKVVRFTVQLEILLKDDWVPICRYDTHHGFAHLDILHPDGTEDKIRLLAKDFKEALNVAFADLLTNWERYIRTYVKGQ
ncbi:MAG: hypothetical protein HYW04_11110 [Deltaproteobacteria bacterium]|nr:hypothetical protein [Deltaproteobacteria bacterium]